MMIRGVVQIEQRGFLEDLEKLFKIVFSMINPCKAISLLGLKEEVRRHSNKRDKIFANQEWLDLFLEYCFIKGVADGSNHTPLWLQLNERRHRGNICPF